MSVALLREWRLPGCGDACHPRLHDLRAHEEFGARQERERARRLVVQTGVLTVDRAAGEARVRGHLRRLRPTEWRILDALAARSGELLVYEELLPLVFGRTWRVFGRRASVSNLRVHLSRLRANLGEAGSLVLTVPYRGIRLEVLP